MNKFYFTYGTDPEYPYQGGWTEIEAPDKQSAIKVFRIFHPDRKDGCMNYAFSYSEAEFKFNGMENGNLGEKCHERIVLIRETAEEFKSGDKKNIQKRLQ